MVTYVEKVTERKYRVVFFSDAGSVEIELTGEIAAKVERAVDAFPPRFTAQRIGAAICVLAELAVGFLTPQSDC